MDYRGVNEFVWEAYWRIYGGGPAIVRKVMDIYSPPVRTPLLEAGTDMKFYSELEIAQRALIEGLIAMQAKREEEKRGANNK